MSDNSMATCCGHAPYTFQTADGEWVTQCLYCTNHAGPCPTREDAVFAWQAANSDEEDSSGRGGRRLTKQEVCAGVLLLCMGAVFVLGLLAGLGVL